MTSATTAPFLDSLALIAVGLLFGFALALVAALTFLLHRAAASLRAETASAVAQISRHAADSASQILHLRTDLTAALAKLDADRIYAASTSLQRTARSLASTTADLQRAVLAQPALPAFDLDPLTGFSALDDEAQADDRRLAADRTRYVEEAGRWATADTPRDPLAALSPDERARRVAQFFQQRERERQQAGAADAYAPFADVGHGTPPAPGSGAYAHLWDAAVASPPSAVPPPDFPSPDEADRVDLAAGGELD